MPNQEPNTDRDELTNSPAATATKSPMLILNGTGYTLDNKLLLACLIEEDGRPESDANGILWTQVVSFEAEPEVQLEIDHAFSALMSLTHQTPLFSHVQWLKTGHATAPSN